MNPFLELLAHTAWKGAAVLALALTAGLLLRKTAAARRYAVWITSVATLAVLPLAMSLLPAWRVLPKEIEQPNWQRVEIENEVGEWVAEATQHEKLEVPVLTPKPVEAAKPAPVDEKRWFTLKQLIESLPKVWLFIALLLLLRLAWSAWCLRRLERSLPKGRCDDITTISREIGLRREPRLLIGAADAVPMVWGVWRPRLLLPQGFEAWSSEKRRGVLLHELAHLKRRDPLALWTAQWVKALHWFNPLAWLTIRQLRADQERACDDTALRHGIRASDYAQTLLDLSRHNRAALGLALCALTITRCAPVESRVKAILDPKCARDPITARWLASLCGLALLLMLPVAMLHAIEGPKLRGRILDRHGVVLAETTQEKSRHYPLKSLASHVLGYTGKTKHDDPTPVGRFGFEKQRDADLNAGQDVTLSLDARLQSLATRAMLDGGITRGAAVVLDPRSGEILAMVSLPAHDPNVFIPSISLANWDKLSTDHDNPLLNRCISPFAPGSVFKPLIGLAGIAAGVGDSRFTCEGSVTYGSSLMQCWIKRQDGGQHGELNLAGALTASCNCFFYQFGNAGGIDQIEKIGNKLGFGNSYGICEQERPGILPGPRWMQENQPNNKWTAGYTANTSIGQGMVLVTPLQMAVLVATLANGGKVPEPSLQAKKGEATWRADLIAEGLPAAQIEQLRKGMRQVVHGENGTGKAARSDKAIITGKTGTAQNWRRIDDKRVEDNHAWFIGFAPYDKPTLAFAILKNGGKTGGGDCAPVAKRIVEEALALPADGSGEVKAVEVNGVGALKPKAIDDLKESEARRSLNQAAEEMGAGSVQILKVSVVRGKLKVMGNASGMIAALAYREKMTNLCKHWDMQWFFPVPQTMSDGQRVRFEAEGLTPTAVEVEKEQKRQKEAMASLNPLERIQKLYRSLWNHLQSKTNLPEPPEGARLGINFKDLPFPKEDRHFRNGFTAPREKALEWLREALQSNHMEFQEWPPEPAPILQRYHVGKSDVFIHSTGGTMVTIVVQTPFAVLPLKAESKLQIWPEMPMPPLFDKVSLLKGEITPEDASPDQTRILSFPKLEVSPTLSPMLRFESPMLHFETPSVGPDDDLENLESRYRGMDRTLLVK
jgi:beta-lactamase regulating signal transducer with metallopeptidase domain/beta-lactamase class D